MSPVLTVWEEDGLTTKAGQLYKFSINVVDVCCNGGYSQSNNAPFDLNLNVNAGGGFSTLASYMSVEPDPSPGTIYTVTGYFTGGSSLDLQIIDAANAPGGNDFAIGNINVSAVPEPATWAMLLASLLGMGAMVCAAQRKASKTA